MNNYLKEIAILGNDNRRRKIEEILDSLGVRYNIVGNKSKNIVVPINPSDKRIVIGAHYDAFYYGANDNGAACVILLNLINDLKNSNKSFDFVFFDMEEQGGVGSREYIEIIGRDNIGAMINLDMCGLGSNIVLTHSFGSKIDSSLRSFYNLIFDENANNVDCLPPGDYNNFVDAGISAMFIINSTDNDLDWYNGDCSIYPEFLETMHQETDTYDSFDSQGMIMIYEFLRKHLIE